MLNADAKKACFINTSFVQIVLPFGYKTQIAPSVIKIVPVFMVNNLAFLRLHYKPGKRNIMRRFFAENNDRAAIGGNTHRSNIAIVFPVRRVAVSIKDFSIDIRVNFDNPVLNFEHQIIDFAIFHKNS